MYVRLMLKRLWLNYVTGNLDANAEYTYLSKVMFVNTFSIVGNLSLLAFSASYILSGNVLFAAVEFVFFLIGVSNLIVLRKTGNAEFASTIILIFMIGVLVFLYVTGGTQSTGILWYATYPLLAFFLKEKKEGLLWLSILVVITLVSALLQRIGIFPIEVYSLSQTALLVVSLFAVTLLAMFYANVRSKLEEMRMVRESEQYQKRLIEDQLDIARSFQQVLFPADSIDAPGAEVAGAYRTAQKVGGDYFDYLMIDDSRIAVILCDVAGHGIPAAMGMVNIRGIFRTLLLGDITSPASTIHMVNNILIKEFRDDHFAVISFYIYDQRTRELRYCNAGQPHAIYYSHNRDGLDEIESVALPLGVLENNDQYRDKTIALEPDDFFIVYTDGIVEAMNSTRDEYGKSRLFESIMRRRDGTAREINAEIIQDIDRFIMGLDMSDDLSVITLRVKKSES